MLNGTGNVIEMHSLICTSNTNLQATATKTAANRTDAENVHDSHDFQHNCANTFGTGTTLMGQFNRTYRYNGHLTLWFDVQ